MGKRGDKSVHRGRLRGRVRDMEVAHKGLRRYKKDGGGVLTFLKKYATLKPCANRAQQELR